MFNLAPQLVAEILSKSTVRADRVLKYEQYAEAGIEDYWIIDPDKKHQERYTLYIGKLQLEAVYESSTLSTNVIPSFNLDVNLLFDY